MEQSQIIDQLQALNKRHKEQAQKFNALSIETLLQKPANGGWNILECIAHISAYSEFYIPEFARVISKGKPVSSKKFKPGIIGGRTAKSMLPDQKGFPLNPMKTFKKMNMAGKVTEKIVLSQFIKQCEELDALLDKARTVDLNTNRCKLTLPLFRFKLGDTLAFHINHNERHMVQALRLI